MAPRPLTTALLLVAVAGTVRAQPSPGPATSRPATALAATRPVLPDPDRWARRNVELLAGLAADVPPEGPPADADPKAVMASEAAAAAFSSAVGFSVTFNPMLARDPYAGDVLRLVEPRVAAVERAGAGLLAGGDDDDGDVVAYLGLPEGERVLRSSLGNNSLTDLGEPLARAGNLFRLPNIVLAVPDADFDAVAVPFADAMDRAARAAGKFDGLALAYQRTARYATLADRPERASLWADRMLDVLLDHPSLQDPQRGNTDAVQAGAVAGLLLDLGRADDLERLIAAYPDDLRTDLNAALAAERAMRGEWDEARRVVRERVAPLTPDSPGAADRLLAALDGKAAPPPPRAALPPDPAPEGRPVRADRPARPRLGPRFSDQLLGQIEQQIARAHARDGAVEVAAAQMIALQSDQSYLPAGPGVLPYYHWARLAQLAREGGHPEAATLAIERAIEVHEAHPSPRDDPAEVAEKTRFVREFLALGDLDAAAGLLSTTSDPGSGARLRLGRAYLERGDERRARALFDEAVDLARDDRGGSVMAAVAVELHRLGDRERAEQILLDAPEHVEGVDFGLGGYAALERATIEMGRPDLLDRLYERADSGGRVLICIMTCGFGSRPDAASG